MPARFIKRITTALLFFCLFFGASHTEKAFAKAEDVKSYLQELTATANKYPEIIGDLDATYEFKVEGVSYQIDVADQQVTFSDIDLVRADSTFIISESTFWAIIKGELSVKEAYLNGKLKIKGSFSKAKKLGKVIEEIREKEKSDDKS